VFSFAESELGEIALLAAAGVVLGVRGPGVRYLNLVVRSFCGRDLAAKELGYFSGAFRKH